MKAEAEEAAHAALDKYAARIDDIAGIAPDRAVREGDHGGRNAELIEEDLDIGILVLAAARARKGRARWSRASPRARATFRSRSLSCRVS